MPYADTLAKQLRSRGHIVKRINGANKLPRGDCAFFLSVENIVPPSVLKRNTHNIVIHASKVPQGKGWSPMAWQILEGKKEITVSLFEAAQKVDSGEVYACTTVHFDGTELIGELRNKEAHAIITLALKFIDSYPPRSGNKQIGKESFYPRRTPADSEIDPGKTILENFNQLRVADNERYPAFFTHKGHTYILKISKKD